MTVEPMFTWHPGNYLIGNYTRQLRPKGLVSEARD
jgi:hypothetical protein